MDDFQFVGLMLMAGKDINDCVQNNKFWILDEKKILLHLVVLLYTTVWA